MKFAKLLLEHPGECFVRYKQLKKQLKKVTEEDVLCFQEPGGLEEGGEGGGSTSPPQPSHQQQHQASLIESEQCFVKMLNEDINRFNEFFMDQEEDFVMRFKLYKDTLAYTSDRLDPVARQKAAKDMADLHGEMVLLIHWSMLNYAAVCKILKKHDKRTGLLLRDPYLYALYQQPFFSTHILERLIGEGEAVINSHLNGGSGSGASGGGGGGGKSLPSVSASGSASASLAPFQQQQEPQQPQQPQQHQDPSSAVSGHFGSNNNNSHSHSSSHTFDDPRAVVGGTGGGGGEGELMRQEVGEILPPALLAKVQSAMEMWDVLTSTAITPSTLIPLPLGGAAAVAARVNVPGSSNYPPHYQHQHPQYQQQGMLRNMIVMNGAESVQGASPIEASPEMTD